MALLSLLALTPNRLSSIDFAEMAKFSSKKIRTDRLDQISIFRLKKGGYLENLVLGKQYDLKVAGQYTDQNGEVYSKWHEVRLDWTPCRLGGRRFWFLCPFVGDGVVCGRRAGILYHFRGDLGCRICLQLTYASQRLKADQRPFGRIISTQELEKLREDVKRTHYRGETRKYKRYLKKVEQANKAMRGSLRASAQKHLKWSDKDKD